MFDPKTNEKLVNHHYLRDKTRNPSGSVGIIQSYNSQTNTATVLIASPDSDIPNDIMTDVMCPVQIGIQTVAPEPGRPCWIVYKGGVNDRKAMISHYFNHNYTSYDYTKQSVSRSAVPRYMLGI